MVYGILAMCVDRAFSSTKRTEQLYKMSVELQAHPAWYSQALQEEILAEVETQEKQGMQTG